MISIICAIGKNRAIGKDNKLLWHLPPDLKHFKKITTGHSVIMGEKTFQSLSRPLPDRTNIVITRNKKYKPRGCLVAHSIDEAIQLAKQSEKKEIFIIGGGQIYKQTIALANKLYLTIVDERAEADTFFPDYSEFKNIVKEEKGEYNGITYKFIELIK